MVVGDNVVGHCGGGSTGGRFHRNNPIVNGLGWGLVKGYIWHSATMLYLVIMTLVTLGHSIAFTTIISSKILYTQTLPTHIS